MRGKGSREGRLWEMGWRGVGGGVWGRLVGVGWNGRKRGVEAARGVACGAEGVMDGRWALRVGGEGGLGVSGR